MKCYRKNGSDGYCPANSGALESPSMKCYRKNGSDFTKAQDIADAVTLPQ